MPATAFDAAVSVIAHSLVPLDPVTLDILQPEEYLLVHSAPCTASNETLEEVNSQGRLVLYVAYNFKLRWTVEADMLAIAGLANYHPGTALSEHSLTFLNGASKPFQFPATSGVGTTGRMVYENPTRTPVAGDLTGIRFEILQIFNDLNDTEYTPGTPHTDTSLPPVVETDPEVLTAAALIWYRAVNLTGPGGHLLVFGLKVFYTLPAGSAVPADYAAFRASVDSRPEVAGENDIIEVYRCHAPAAYILESPDDYIAGRLGNGHYSFPPLNWNFAIQYADPGDGSFLGSEFKPQQSPPLLTAGAVAAAYPPPAGHVISAIYDVEQAVWLL